MASVRGVYASIGGGAQSHFSHILQQASADCHCILAGESMISSNMTISAFYRTQKLRFNVPQTYFVFNCQFLLRQAFADNEASIRLLQILLFLLLFTASLMFIPCAIRSSFTLSIHFFGCLPLLLVPSTCPYSATTGSLFPSILVTCPNHVSLLFLILSINVTFVPSSFLVTSDRK